MNEMTELMASVKPNEGSAINTIKLRKMYNQAQIEPSEVDLDENGNVLMFDHWVKKLYPNFNIIQAN